MKLKFFICLCLLLVSIPALANEIEFGDWYGVYDNGQKTLIGFSGSDDVSLTIYVDDQYFTRLKFSPPRRVRIATFDHKRKRGMRYDHLYGYDHWIRPMKKAYRMQVWFENDRKYEVFSLKGFSKGIRWLQSKKN